MESVLAHELWRPGGVSEIANFGARFERRVSE